MSVLRTCPSSVRAALAAAAVLALPALAAADIIYVDETAAGKQTGGTWEDAFITLQDALAAAAPGDQIWVAQATYEPDQGGGLPGDRNATFQLISGVALYGGFQGTETLLDERDPEMHPTVLSGDLNENDGPSFANNGENSFHVVTGSGVNATAILDGFTVQGGNANGIAPGMRRGGGMVNASGSPTVVGCRFTSNFAVDRGGAVDNVTSAATFRACAFESNESGDIAAGMSNTASSQVRLDQCLFQFNVAAGPGGGVFDDGLSLTVNRCFFIQNEAGFGGGLACQAQAILANVLFIQNSASSGGGLGITGNGAVPRIINTLFSYNEANAGAAINVGSAVPVELINCTLGANNAVLQGGGVRANPGILTFRNCILWDNSDSGGSGAASQISLSGGATADVAYSLVQGGWAGAGNLSSDPQFENPLDLGFLLPTSPAIDAGDNGAVPQDLSDVDLDGDTLEQIPFDAGGIGRVIESIYAPDTGNGAAPFVDMGAYEFWQKMLLVDPAGQGWPAAGVYANLQDALAILAEPGTHFEEVWIVAGTYKPDIGDGIMSGDRSASFAIPSGKGVYGGFKGDEVIREQRNPSANATILSGDLSGNDTPYNPVEPGSVPASWNENSYHVVSAVDGGTGGLIDGVTITHGRANGAGAFQNMGSGLFVDETSITARNCLVELNTASGVGGGATTRADGHPASFIPRFESCTFRRNQASLGGGGLRNSQGNSVVEDCAFIENASAQGGGLSIVGDSPDKVAISRCMFQANLANSGGAVLMDLSLDPGSVIADSSFLRNRANADGGAIYSYDGGFTVVNCTFSGNTAINGSGAIRPPANLGASGVDVVNCAFAGNTSAAGGVMKAELSSGNGSLLRLTNCTFASNQASADGGALWCNYGAGPTIRNCVLWNNEDAGGTDGTAQVFVSGGAPTVNYSLVQGGWSGAGGTGVITANPLFAAAPDPGPDGDWDGVNDDYGDLRPSGASPAIDAGDNSAVPASDVADLDDDGITAEPLPLDLGGEPRRIDDLLSADSGAGAAPLVDLGAHEFSRDCNGNGISDDQDLATCAGDPACDDCDGNDVPDVCDILGCNPAVEPACDDCNLNGVPDGCDIAAMTSNDGDLDGVPDECAQFVGGCPPGQEELWSCPQNWLLEDAGDDYPDNVQFGGPFNVVLDGGDDVFLDVPAVINTLVLRDNAVLRVTAAGGPGPQPPADLTVIDPAGIDCGATILVGSDRSIDVGGAMTVGAGGFYGPDAGGGETAAAMIAGDVTVIEGPAGEAGTVQLDGGMGLEAGGDFVLIGSDDNCTPPILRVADSSAMAVDGDIVVQGAGDILITSGAPLVLGGDFINESTRPEIFDWLDGALCIGACAGGGPAPATAHTFEVAGRDLGPTPAGLGLNFAIGTLEISSGASVSFVDQFDNDLAGQPACSEALYVRQLILRRGAAIQIVNSSVYYLELIDEGGQITAPECGLAQILPPAGGIFDCADADGDDVRDDGCVWWAVDLDGACTAQAVHYADMGGAFGACAPDGAADGNDRFHALNCFSNQNTVGGQGYPCEADSPAAYNVDAAALGSPCTPDGVCDGNDAFAALNAFTGSTPCSCPANPGGPAPGFSPQPPDPERFERAHLELRPSAKAVRPGGLVEVDVHLASPLADLRGYQLHLAARGGRSGRLDLADIFIREPSVFAVLPNDERLHSARAALDERRATSDEPLHSARAALDERRATSDERQDFTSRPYWSAFNLRSHQMLAGLDSAGIAAPAGSYLGTFVYRAGEDARGTFTLEILADRKDASQRTFLFPTPAAGVIEILPGPPVTITVTQASR
jgi:hypothetical protein